MHSVATMTPKLISEKSITHCITQPADMEPSEKTVSRKNCFCLSEKDFLHFPVPMIASEFKTNS